MGLLSEQGYPASKGLGLGAWVDCTQSSSTHKCFFKCERESKRSKFKAICKPKATGIWDVEESQTYPDCPICYGEDRPSEYNVPGASYSCKNKRGNVECELGCDWNGWKRPPKASRSYAFCDNANDQNPWSSTGVALSSTMCDPICTTDTNPMVSNGDSDLDIPNSYYKCEKRGSYDFKCELFVINLNVRLLKIHARHLVRKLESGRRQLLTMLL